MKPLIFAIAALSLVGCSSSAPYTILERHTGPTQNTTAVEVPPSAADSEMEGWCKDVTASDSGGKDMLVNFYIGGMGAEHMVGSCYNKDFSRTRS